MIADAYSVHLDQGNNLSLSLHDSGLLFSESDARDYTIWLRKPDVFYLTSSRNQAFENEYLAEEVRAFMDVLYLVFSQSRWLNPIDAVNRANNRIHQLKVAKEIGINVPEFMITNSSKAGRDFWERQGRDLVIKRLSTRRIPLPEGMDIFTARIDEADLDKPEFREGINYLQRAIPTRTEIRVTIVGEEVFACSFERDLSDPSVIDYRQQESKPTSFAVHTLPGHLRTKLIELTRYFSLSFAAIDMLLDDLGGYFFLEMNPNGQFLWIEDRTDMPISLALARELSA